MYSRGNMLAFLATSMSVAVLAQLEPEIHSVSPSIGGSAGGTLLTIRGVGLGDGFDRTPVVTIAGIPCDVESFYSADTRLQCRVRSWHSWSDSGNRNVEVRVNGVLAACKGSCRYRWYHGYVPNLQSVYTTQSGTGSNVSFRVRTMTSDPEIVDVHIGDRMCGWADGDAADGDTFSMSGDWTTYKCAPDSEREGGLYNISVRVNNRNGNAWPESRSYRIGAGSRRYHHMAMPVVTSVSPKDVSLLGGAEVTILGSGFSHIEERVSVRVSGVPCDVRESTPTMVKCVTRRTGRTARQVAYEAGTMGVADQPETRQLYVMGPAGARVERYDNMGQTGSMGNRPDWNRVQQPGGYDALSHKAGFENTRQSQDYFLQRGMALFQPQHDG